MTTTVRVLIEGNKNCKVSVVNPDGSPSGQPEHIVSPKSFCQVLIHGEQRVEVQETGDFVS